ncbi:MAG: hypothetical protein LZF60_160169 [Nitrospira sp.]|nr:MAG: hypothetical protein LZF60_160169 [Nitrospira sp.]
MSQAFLRRIHAISPARTKLVATNNIMRLGQIVRRPIFIGYDRNLRRAILGHHLTVFWQSARFRRLVETYAETYNVAGMPDGPVRRMATAGSIVSTK